MADLAMMPHLLIAGSTGTGKSVGLNSMLTSILYRSTPDDVRMIMIDPKRLELGMYEDIPHLMTPVVVDPKKAANALRWAVREMEERYKTLAAFGVRNIDQYNRNVRAMIEAKEDARRRRPAKRPLPFIVVVVDELADLMMVAGNEVEESICRLAQMARAVGIHLILATQRPSVDVITGLIKANLPSRISFRVSSKIDSRTILDSNGAEQLLGKGDMLFLPPASSRHIRLHGPYISEQESARVASFLRKQGKPHVRRDDYLRRQEGREKSSLFEKDDLYDEAARIVVETGQVSISYLQRKMRIGFSRAARLVDMMEAEGLVSPTTGGKPREVLVDRSYFDEVDAQLRYAVMFAARSRLVLALTGLSLVIAVNVSAQQTAKDRFTTAMEREQDIRTSIEAMANDVPTPSDLLAQLNRVLTSYEIIVRRFPSSGYADNALWQAASLADAAYQKFLQGRRPRSSAALLQLARQGVSEQLAGGSSVEADCRACRGEARPARRRQPRRPPRPRPLQVASKDCSRSSRDVIVDSASRPAGVRADHAGARSRGDVSRRASRRSRARVLRFEIGAGGSPTRRQGVSRTRTTSFSRFASVVILTRRCAWCLDLENRSRLQRVHALQPVSAW